MIKDWSEEGGPPSKAFKFPANSQKQVVDNGWLIREPMMRGGWQTVYPEPNYNSSFALFKPKEPTSLWCPDIPWLVDKAEPNVLINRVKPL